MKTAKTLKIIGVLPIGFLALVSLVFGIGESSGEDWRSGYAGNIRFG